MPSAYEAIMRSLLKRQGPAARFLRDARGQAAIAFGIALVPLIGVTGAAIDYSRATALQSRIQGATDAAVLAAAQQTTKMNNSELEALARKIFTAQVNDPNARFDKLKVSKGRTELTGNASATSPNTMARFLGFASLEVKAEAKAVVNTSIFEIALVIDNSGSMAGSASGSTKLQAVQQAANSMIDTMLKPGTMAADRTRISIVPFSLAVQVGNQYSGANWVDTEGKSSIHWQNVNPSGSGTSPKSRLDLFTWMNIPWGGCFETRPGNFATSDLPPDTSTNDSLFVPMFAPDEPGNAGDTITTIRYNNQNYLVSYPNSYVNDNPSTCSGSDSSSSSEYDEAQRKMCKYRNAPLAVTSSGRGPNYMCNSGPVVRLTNNTTALHASVNAMQADGSTNLLEGFTWGWRTLSDQRPFGDGKPYNTPDVKKIIVFLTDGMNSWSSAYNHNQSQYSPMGYYGNNRFGTGVTTMDEARARLDAKTLEACSNFKAKNVNAAGADPSVVIYTVGVSTPGNPIDAQGISLLRSCATSADKAYIAATGADVVAVFDAIARSITGLRLAE